MMWYSGRFLLLLASPRGLYWSHHPVRLIGQSCWLVGNALDHPRSIAWIFALLVQCLQSLRPWNVLLGRYDVCELKSGWLLRRGLVRAS